MNGCAPISAFGPSVTGCPAAGDVQRLACDERGPFEVENRVDDVFGPPETADGVTIFETIVQRRVLLGGLDYSGSDGVDAHAARRVFRGQ